MNVNTARKFDFWVGAPICFILSIFYFLKKKIRKNKIENKKPRKILFIELSEIGSAILTYPAIKRVKEKYPSSILYFLIFKENSEGIRILDIIEEGNIISINDINFLLLAIDTIKSLWRIRLEKIDVVIDCELFSRFSSILTYLSGAKTRVGFHKYTLEGLYRGNFLTRKVIYNPYIHIVKNFISLVNSLDTFEEESPLLKRPIEEIKYDLPKINPDAENIELIWERLESANRLFSKDKKIIIVHLSFNDKLSIRKWPLEYYLDLIKRLLKVEGVFVILLGVNPNKKQGVIPEFERCINLIGNTTIKDLINLFNISHILISHDSGMIHIASLTSIFIFVLFGPETPLLYQPLIENKTIFYKEFSCSPCLSAYNYRITVCKDNKCMQAITVDEVFNEVIKIIQ